LNYCSSEHRRFRRKRTDAKIAKGQEFIRLISLRCPVR
jgi:hypothetical protein